MIAGSRPDVVGVRFNILVRHARSLVPSPIVNRAKLEALDRNCLPAERSAGGEWIG